MHYDDQRYKEDFVRFLSAYYEGKVSEDSLVEYIRPEGPGPAFDTLEKQLREYLANLKTRVDASAARSGLTQPFPFSGNNNGVPETTTVCGRTCTACSIWRSVN